MTKGLSYHYYGTKGHIIEVAQHLPPNPDVLLSMGWEDISDPRAAFAGYHVYKEAKTGLKIRFDPGKIGASGFRGKNHYHIYNPDADSNQNLYLNKNGEPVKKSSPESHIMPEEDI